MKSIHSFKRGVAKVRRLWLARDYEQALAEVSRLLQDWPDNPYLLIMWADLIQLQGENEGPTLEDAKAAYQRAIALDEKSPAALIELGKYIFAVEDDTMAATKVLAGAIRLSKHLLKEAFLAQAEVLVELERRQEALACLAEAYWLGSHNNKVNSRRDPEEILERLESLRKPD